MAGLLAAPLSEEGGRGCLRLILVCADGPRVGGAARRESPSTSEQKRHPEFALLPKPHPPPPVGL